MTWRRSVALVVSVVIVVTACESAPSPVPTPGRSAPAASAPAASPSSESTVPSPIDYEQVLYGFTYAPSAGRSGGTVTIGRPINSSQLNPYFTDHFADSQVIVATMPTLLTVSADGHWMPWLSDGPITYSSSVKRDVGPSAGFAVHVRIRPNLKWSDSEPFSLNDMAYTWKAVLDVARAGLETGINMSGWDAVDRIDVSADGMDADVHFKDAYAGWLSVVGANVILPEHYMSDIPKWSESYPASARLVDAVTLGPFKYAVVTPDTINLVRDDNWAGPAVACAGKACLDGITYRSFADNKEGEITAFLHGEIDLAQGLTQGVDDAAITEVDPAIGRVISEPPEWRYEHLDFNQAGLGQGRGHPALRDVVVRRAIAQAIDKKAMWEAVFPGAAHPNNNPCTVATPTNYWRLPDAQCLPFDVNAANAALDLAGYARGADGIRVDPRSGTPLVFEHCTMTVSFRELGFEHIAKSLEAIGIKLNRNFVDSTSILFANWSDVKADTKCSLARGNYDTAEFLYALAIDPYDNYQYSYASEQIPTDANNGQGYNYLRLANDEMDAALNALKAAITPEEQLQAVYTVQQLYIHEVPEVVLYYPSTSVGVSARLNNFLKNPSLASDMWNVQDWWLQQ